MAYMQKADMAREKNDFLSSKEEFQYLRQAAVPQIIYVGTANGMQTANGTMAAGNNAYFPNVNSVEDPDVVDLNMYNQIKKEQELEFESEEEYNLFH